ncbi:MAG TPA: DUF6526 family protein [Pyrinomonadaceae bacterium]|nr:DUF6526 family protein [Pyrinomonadaceae bacterium]HNU08275.1 DUF6526 family protein [Pyrinomonadaceae bacterium]
MAETQNYKNHTRWFPLFHFVITPLLLFNLVWQSYQLYYDRSWDRAEWTLMALVFILITLAARIMALKAQDRVIRLEERLRYEKLLPADLAAKASTLKTGDIIALRFASDEELPDLANRVVAGEFASTKEIKLAIKNWRGDYLRV